MKEQLISLKTAKVAKEKGFNIRVPNSYIGETFFNNRVEVISDELYEVDLDEFDKNWNEPKVVFNSVGYICFGCKLDNKIWFNAYSAPTQSLLQQWLRKCHNIHVSVDPEFYQEYPKPQNRVNICKIGVVEPEWLLPGLTDEYLFDTYEEALEVGLFEALKLIKQ